MDEFKDSPEALEWLQANPNQDSGFASNRFTVEAATEFVQQLYARGATKVVIPEMVIREEDIGDGVIAPYADAMAVFYEPNVPGNEALVRMCLQEIEEEGFLVKEEEGVSVPATIEETLPKAMQGSSFYLWWD